MIKEILEDLVMVEDDLYKHIDANKYTSEGLNDTAFMVGVAMDKLKELQERINILQKEKWV
tara:strand:- start:7592 stop:7774 length:183 start_codon:yes stop_codon:yes gene_type:complete